MNAVSRLSLLLAGSLAVFSIPAAAATAGGPPPMEGWNFRLGAAAIYAPDYEGSDDYEFKAVPDIEITYEDWFFFNRDGLGVNVLRNGPLVAGIAILPDLGREDDDNSALRGLGDVDATAEVKVFATYTVGRLAFSAKLRADALGEGHDGVLADIAASYVFMPARGTLVIAGPSLTWASDNYMSSYFGIDAAQSAASGYGVYDAGSGLKDAGFSLIVVSDIGGNWSVTGLAGYKRLLGDAADSPIVAVQGDRDQFFTGLGLSYRF